MARSGLNVIFNGMIAAAAGRIVWRRNMWAIVGGKWDKKRVETTNDRLKGSGRVTHLGHFVSKDSIAALVRRSSVHNCPKPPEPGFYQISAGKFCVPEPVCRACTYFKGAGNGYRYIRCLARSANDPMAVVGMQVQAALDQAKEKLS